MHLPCMDIIQIVKRVAELAEKYNCKMSQIAIAWQWTKGILSPIIGATKTQYLDDSAGAFDIKLTAEDLAYLEEPLVQLIKIRRKVLFCLMKRNKVSVIIECMDSIPYALFLLLNFKKNAEI